MSRIEIKKAVDSQCATEKKERKKGVMMGSRPEGQGKTRGRTEQQRKQVRDWEPERRIL